MIINNITEFAYMDENEVNKHQKYYDKYYGSEFKDKQGLDELTDMIHTYSKPGDWIDLGGGTTTFIWMPAFSQLSRVISVDLDIEALYVQDKVRNRPPSGCYKHVLARYNKNFLDMGKIEICFGQADLFKGIVADYTCNNISQVGLLGLCKTAHEYIHHLKAFTGFMSPDSVFFGANWIFAEQRERIMGFSNRYLSESLIMEAREHIDIKILHLQHISIENDPLYNSVLIYAFTKMQR